MQGPGRAAIPAGAVCCGHRPLSRHPGGYRAGWAGPAPRKLSACRAARTGGLAVRAAAVVSGLCHHATAAALTPRGRRPDRDTNTSGQAHHGPPFLSVLQVGAGHTAAAPSCDSAVIRDRGGPAHAGPPRRHARTYAVPAAFSGRRRPYGVLNEQPVISSHGHAGSHPWGCQAFDLLAILASQLTDVLKAGQLG